MAKKFLPEFRWMGRNVVVFNQVLRFCCCCVWLIFHAKKNLEASKAYQFLSILSHLGISESFNPSLWGAFLY